MTNKNKSGISGWQRVVDLSLPVEEQKEKARIRARDWYANNKERAREQGRLDYIKHKQDANWVKEQNERQKRAIQVLRRQVIEYYGSDCVCCGETTYEFLTLDHVNGGGTKHRKAVSGTSPYTYWNWFIKNNFPIGFQILCMNCNFAKGSNGICPHQRRE